MRDHDGVLRLIAHLIPWPRDGQLRPALELKWRVMLGEEMLIAASRRPLEDGAALLASRGEDPEARITMRHADRAYDSFVPMRLAVAAKPGLKRMENAQRFRDYLALKREAGDSSDEQAAPAA